jgi:hypothetical protein
VHWKRRWVQNTGESPGNRRDTARAAHPIFSYDTLKKHQHLCKHESSLLTQIRTGKVGLRAFLFERKVPEVATPRCPCREALETAAHLVLNYLRLDRQGVNLQWVLYTL